MYIGTTTPCPAPAPVPLSLLQKQGVMPRLREHSIHALKTSAVLPDLPIPQRLSHYFVFFASFSARWAAAAAISSLGLPQPFVW